MIVLQFTVSQWGYERILLQWPLLQSKKNDEQGCKQVLEVRKWGSHFLLALGWPWHSTNVKGPPLPQYQRTWGLQHWNFGFQAQTFPVAQRWRELHIQQGFVVEYERLGCEQLIWFMQFFARNNFKCNERTFQDLGDECNVASSTYYTYKLGTVVSRRVFAAAKHTAAWIYTPSPTPMNVFFLLATIASTSYFRILVGYDVGNPFITKPVMRECVHLRSSTKTGGFKDWLSLL
jgi:hypothetical protein